MSSLMHAFFGTELTIIAWGMQKLLGGNFNNALCNGITWLVVFWITLHFTYDRLINFYLKHLGFSQYLRIRLSDSLWLLACYFSFFIYYLMTIDEYNTKDFMYYRRTIEIYDEVISDKQNIAQAVVCSFHLFMAFREGTQMGSWHAFKHVTLTIAFTTAFILRFLEIPCTITALIAVSGIFQELSKMFYSLLNKENSICNVVIWSLYISSLIIFCAVYFTIIPLSYLIPLAMKLFSRERSVLITTLFLSLLCWINFLIYKSIFLNAMFHWLYHIKNPSKDKHDEEQPIELECLGNIVECSLFPPRTDDSFILAFMRSEARKRQRKINALRRPRNRTLMMQTLRCMLALQKKLNKKRTLNPEAATKAQEEPTSVCYIAKNQEARDNRTKRVLVPVKITNKMHRLSEEETLLKVENLDTNDNAEEEESEIRTVEAKSKSDISINENEENVANTVKESQSDTEIFEDSTKEENSQTMQSRNVTAADKDSQTTQSKEINNKNVSSIGKCRNQEKSIQTIELDGGSKNVACPCQTSTELTKKEGGGGNGNKM